MDYTKYNIYKKNIFEWMKNCTGLNIYWKVTNRFQKHLKRSPVFKKNKI